MNEFRKVEKLREYQKALNQCACSGEELLASFPWTKEQKEEHAEFIEEILHK